MLEPRTFDPAKMERECIAHPLEPFDSLAARFDQDDRPQRSHRRDDQPWHPCPRTEIEPCSRFTWNKLEQLRRVRDVPLPHRIERRIRHQVLALVLLSKLANQSLETRHSRRIAQAGDIIARFFLGRDHAACRASR